MIKNLAIIMDGNRRWAKNQNLEISQGHEAGAKNILPIVQKSIELGISNLVLYALSTENLFRNENEVQNLYNLIIRYFESDKNNLLGLKIPIIFIGNLDNLPSHIQTILQNIMNETEKFNSNTKLYIALNYGGRQEILAAINKILQTNDFMEQNSKNRKIEDLSPYLSAPEISNIDLLIRTGGNQRISNFLLWQIAYAEILFTNTLWPNFDVQEYENICIEYKTIERRYGI